MIQSIAEDDVARFDQRANRPDVGCEPSGEQHGRFCPLEIGDGLFQFCMKRRPPAHERTRPATCSISTRRIQCCGDHARVTRQPQIVV